MKTQTLNTKGDEREDIGIALIVFVIIIIMFTFIGTEVENITIKEEREFLENNNYTLVIEYTSYGENCFVKVSDEIVGCRRGYYLVRKEIRQNEINELFLKN